MKSSARHCRTKSKSRLFVRGVSLFLSITILFAYFREPWKNPSASLNSLKKHFFRSYPIAVLTVESLIDYHPLQCLGILCHVPKPVFIPFEVAEIPLADWIHIIEHRFYNRDEPMAHVVGGHGMWTVEIYRFGVILHEQVAEMCKRILRAKHTPNSIAVKLVIAIKLMLLHIGKLVDQLRRDFKRLLAVCAW